MSPADSPRVPHSPSECRIDGVRIVPRTVHLDRRGSLVETLRRDDRDADGNHFAMSYTSVTVPGEFRDRDRWHVHRRQTDRFVVSCGNMILALFDPREGSTTRGRFELLEMQGVPLDQTLPPLPEERTSYLVTIPPGVYHAIGNLAAGPFVLQNFPTELFDAGDEGRVPFAEVPVPSLGEPFAWTLVDATQPRAEE